jgi:hypothetical protein
MHTFLQVGGYEAPGLRPMCSRFANAMVGVLGPEFSLGSQHYAAAKSLITDLAQVFVYVCVCAFVYVCIIVSMVHVCVLFGVRDQLCACVCDCSVCVCERVCVPGVFLHVKVNVLGSIFCPLVPAFFNPTIVFAMIEACAFRVIKVYICMPRFDLFLISESTFSSLLITLCPRRLPHSCAHSY